MGEERMRREVPGHTGKEEDLERRDRRQKRPVLGLIAIALPQQEMLR